VLQIQRAKRPFRHWRDSHVNHYNKLLRKCCQIWTGRRKTAPRRFDERSLVRTRRRTIDRRDDQSADDNERQAVKKPRTKTATAAINGINMLFVVLVTPSQPLL